MAESDLSTKRARMAVSIDSDLQSRQLATYGVSVMERLAGASILIIGMNGVGVEVAKNIVLANVRRVTLADDRIAAWSDMPSRSPGWTARNFVMSSRAGLSRPWAAFSRAAM